MQCPGLHTTELQATKLGWDSLFLHQPTPEQLALFFGILPSATNAFSVTAVATENGSIIPQKYCFLWAPRASLFAKTSQ